MRKKLAIFGIAALLLMSVTIAFATETGFFRGKEPGSFPETGFCHRMSGFKHFPPGMRGEGPWTESGPAREQSTEEMKEKMDEQTAEIREELGLPEDATREQVMEAMREAQVQKVKEKLGLPEDASEEEVLDALKEWGEENKELLGMRHLRMGCWHNSREG